MDQCHGGGTGEGLTPVPTGKEMDNTAIDATQYCKCIDI
jgi:hypothetical protein